MVLWYELQQLLFQEKAEKKVTDMMLMLLSSRFVDMQIPYIMQL